MAAPTIRGWATATHSTDMVPAFAVTLPTRVAGDLLIAFISCDTIATAITRTQTTTWAQISEEAGGSCRLAIYGRIATNDANDNLTVAGPNSNDGTCNIVAITAGTHNVTNPATDIVTVAIATGTSTTANPPSVNGGSAKDWLALAVAVVDLTATGSTISAAPTNYTTGAILQKSAASTSSVALGIGSRALTAATTEDPGTFTNTSGVWLAKTLLIPPAMQDGAVSGAVGWVGSVTGSRISAGSAVVEGGGYIVTWSDSFGAGAQALNGYNGWTTISGINLDGAGNVKTTNNFQWFANQTGTLHPEQDYRVRLTASIGAATTARVGVLMRSDPGVTDGVYVRVDENGEFILGDASIIDTVTGLDVTGTFTIMVGCIGTTVRGYFNDIEVCSGTTTVSDDSFGLLLADVPGDVIQWQLLEVLEEATGGITWGAGSVIGAMPSAGPNDGAVSGAISWVGSVTGEAPVLTGQSVRFDNAADRYSRAVTGLTSTNFTMSCWAYLSVDTAAYTSFVVADDATSTYNGLQCPDGVSLQWNTQGAVIDSGIDLSVGVWYFMAISFTSGGTSVLYWADEDDLSLSSASASGLSVINSGQTFWIGSNGWTKPLNGRIADIKVWSAALTLAELEAERESLYDVVRTADLWAHYSFEGGPQTNDESGNSRTLTSAGTPTAEAGPTGVSGGPNSGAVAGAISWVGTVTGSKVSKGTTNGAVIWTSPASVTPTWVGRGVFGPSTVTLVPALPSGIVTNDILLLFVETANEVVTISDQAGGTWTEVTGSPVGIGTAGATNATRLTMFWSRYNGTQTAPTVADAGDHTFGCIGAWRGCVITGNPIDITSTGTDGTSPATLTIPGATTTIANSLIVGAVACDVDIASSTVWSTAVNTDLVSTTERLDSANTAGNGGGLMFFEGRKALPGTYGSTSTTQSSGVVACASMTLALIPVSLGGLVTGTTSHKGSVSGAISRVGTVTGVRVPKGSVAGAISRVGSIIGESPPDSFGGSVNGAIARTGSVTGTRLPKGSVSGAITRTGVIIGGALGFVSGAIARAGSVTGKRLPKASISGAITRVGTVTGVKPLVGMNDGSVTGAVTRVGSVIGKSVRNGSLTGLISWTGAVTGKTTNQGLVTGAITWIGIVDGPSAPPVGYITGNIFGPGVITRVVKGPSTRRLIKGPDLSRVLVGPDILIETSTGPSHTTHTMKGPDVSRTTTGPGTSRTITGPET